MMVGMVVLIISLKEKMVTESGSVKYPMLLSLFKTITSLSYGNSAPKNGFSINRFIVGLHGNSIQADKDDEGYDFESWIHI